MLRWIACGAASLLVPVLACAADDSSVWLDVPFVRQEKNGCGAASVAMIMQYWRQDRGVGPAPDAEEIQQALFASKARGIYASDLEGFLQSHGFTTFRLRGEWSDLRQHLEKGRPLIVTLAQKGNALHYVVVAGMDWRQQLVLKNDPAVRKLLKQHREEFERQWRAAGNWMLLALPKESADPPR